MVQTRAMRTNSGTRPQRGLPQVRSRAKYKPGDDCKRHRLPSNKAKNVLVTSYRRRKP